MAWMLADALYSPDIYLDQVDRTTVVDTYVRRIEAPESESKPDVGLIRHPLDVCCSAFNYLLLTNRINENKAEKFFTDYIESRGSVSPLNKGATWQSTMLWLENNASNIVLYDDLVKNPEKVLQTILGKKDVSASVDKYSLEKLRLREKDVDQKKIKRVTNKNYSFFNKGTTMYHKEIMSPEVQTLGNAVFREHIDKYWG